MAMSELKLKSVHDLLGKKFYIPDYQRGYRWTKTEVKNLLGDIKDFFDKDGLTKTNYYCLQPLVVCKSQKEPDAWEVIDGQQRLTTICIILNNLKNYLDDECMKNLVLNYQTRDKSEEYLQNIDETRKTENIDFYHIFEADKTIKEFFSSGNSKGDMFRYLTNATDVGKNVRFIWYDVTDEIRTGKVKAIDIFTRLNIGKIPLTNAELLKALFLSKEYLSENIEAAKEMQVRIAQDWDRIEKQLQKDDFWYFLYGNGTYNYSTRIEFLFDLQKGNHHKNDEEERHTFNEFYKEFSNSKNKHSQAATAWKEISNLFGIFENWYEDRALYHLIGYNTAIGNAIDTLLNELKNSDSNTDFKKKLLEKAKGATDIKQLSYNENHAEIRKTLLLFNILSMLSNKKSEDRFPFHHFQNQNWDIEHVSPQTEQEISGKDRKSWLITNISYFTGVELPLKTSDFKEEKFIREAKAAISSDAESKEKEFAKLLIDLYESDASEQEKNSVLITLRTDLAHFFNEDAALDKDNISNLVLLDAGTNRMYKNAFFPVKRKWIIERERNGVFVPLCTKNVFMKAYSSNFSNLTAWTEQDAEAYEQAIERVFSAESID